MTVHGAIAAEKQNDICLIGSAGQSDPPFYF